MIGCKALDLEQEPKTGHWIDANTQQEWYDEEFVCSECKGHMLGTSEFCPYCGVRMESEVRNEI